MSESDGSLHLPLSSRRTNYKVMDSRLITRAMSGFKLVGSWCRVWCDGEGQERRGRKDTSPEGKRGDVEKEELKRCTGGENIHCSFSLSASSPSFIALLLSSAPFIQKLYFPSGVSGFCFVSALSSLALLSLSSYFLPLLSLRSFFLFIPLRLWRSVS